MPQQPPPRPEETSPEHQREVSDMSKANSVQPGRPAGDAPPRPQRGTNPAKEQAR